MEDLCPNLDKTGWTDKIWSRRYEAIQVSSEKEAQAKRLKYILAHGAKEGLVARPQEWPGVHCVGPLLAGQSEVQGTWYDRSREYILRRRGKDFTPADYTQQQTITLTPPPCWKGLSPEDCRTRIEELVQLIVSEAEAERAQTGKEPLGPEAIRRQKSGTRPQKVKRSPAPYFHAIRKKVRKALYEGFALFVAEYREASEKLRAGDSNVRFPLGCFPPGLPFVSEAIVPA